MKITIVNQLKANAEAVVNYACHAPGYANTIPNYT